ncbi:MAG: hypothetical protein LAO79_11390 [Acidobacteriia bacterium]|nr:hypothetical protein [Terriglobia bacterium]
MTDAIVGKLARFLQHPIDSECKVVYLLAEVRKVLERDDRGHAMGSLWMYCHWALHVDLDSPKTTEEFLGKVERWVTNTVAYLTPTGPWNFWEEFRLFRDFIYLDTFRRQLNSFLTSYGLPADLCSDDNQWNSFMREYAGVIEDGSLSAIGKKSALQVVEKVTFEKGNALTHEHHVPFVIRWIIDLNDGRELKTSVETVPRAGGKMTAHHLEIVNNAFVPPN